MNNIDPEKLNSLDSALSPESVMFLIATIALMDKGAELGIDISNEDARRVSSASVAQLCQKKVPFQRLCDEMVELAHLSLNDNPPFDEKTSSAFREVARNSVHLANSRGLIVIEEGDGLTVRLLPFAAGHTLAAFYLMSQEGGAGLAGGKTNGTE